MVAADSVEIRNGGAITSVTYFGSGDAGDVEVTADRILVFSDAGPGFTSLISITFFGTGDSGDVTLRASSLEVREALVGTAAIGPGSGGDVRIFVDSLLLDGNGIVTPEFGDPELLTNPIDFTQISAGGLIPTSGPAGNIEIVAHSVVVRGGASIDSGTSGDSRGGNIDITANKWFGHRRVRGSIIFRNLLNQRFRYHPVGATFDLSVLARFEFYLGTLNSSKGH